MGALLRQWQASFEDHLPDPSFTSASLATALVQIYRTEHLSSGGSLLSRTMLVGNRALEVYVQGPYTHKVFYIMFA